MNGLLRSRKFLLLCLDALITILSTALAMFVQEKYPLAVEFIKIAILALQPVFVAVILGIAHEDAALMRSGGTPAKPIR